MFDPALAALVATIALATYFQTVTGFGLGMIVMGAASAFALAPLPDVATIISLVTLVNSAVVLHGRFGLVDWPAARAIVIGVIPAMVAGVLLLGYLSDNAARVLQFLLGMAIVLGGVVFALRPTPKATRSGNRSFVACGLAAGLFGGMFGIAGPPVIFHFYRQPMPLEAVRCMLLLVFAMTASSRTVFIALQGRLDAGILVLAAIASAVVAVAAFLGRRYPPPIPPMALRRIAYGTLIVIGASLMASASIAA